MLSKATGWIIGGLIVLLILSAIFRPYDSTDGTDRRSGLALYVDEGTGCHYIKGGMFGTMVPRMVMHRHRYVHLCDELAYDDVLLLRERGRE